MYRWFETRVSEWKYVLLVLFQLVEFTIAARSALGAQRELAWCLLFVFVLLDVVSEHNVLSYFQCAGHRKGKLNGYSGQKHCLH